MRIVILALLAVGLFGQVPKGSGGGGGGGSSAGGSGVSYCAPASASGATYTCAPSPALTSYANGTTLGFVPDVTATAGAVTVNVNSLGAKSIKESDGSTNPTATDLVAGKSYALLYDGTVFRIIGSGTTTFLQSVGGLSSIAIVHNLNTSQPWVSCYDSTGNIFGGSTATVSITNVVATSANIATVTFSIAAPASSTCAVSTGGTGPPGAIGPAGTITGDLMGTFVTGAGVLSAGSVVYGSTPAGCTISGFDISTVPADTATFDVWVAGAGTTVATVANTITAAALPAISTGSFLHSTTLTGWTTAVLSGRSYAIKLTIVGGTATYANLRVICR